jgi:hypothetical protein
LFPVLNNLPRVLKRELAPREQSKPSRKLVGY